jgi:uncharacterized lipoprotein YajG
VGSKSKVIKILIITVSLLTLTGCEVPSMRIDINKEDYQLFPSNIKKPKSEEGFVNE